MTATEQLIAKQVSDVFPASVDDLPLGDAARRGLIAPLRSLRVRPAAAISSVPIVGGDYDQEILAKVLDQEIINQAAASLYRDRFDETPGIVYAAGVEHAYNLAREFRAAGLKAEAVSGRTPPVRLAETLAAYERGEINILINAQLLAEGWNSPRATVCMHLAPTASRRVYQQRIGRIMRLAPRKEAGIVVDFVDDAATHNERTITIHSLLDSDFYRPGARVTPAPRRRIQRRARRKLSPAPWLVPVTPDPRRRVAVITREWERVDPSRLADDEQLLWARIAGRQVRFEERQQFAEKLARASRECREAFLMSCAAENPNRRLRLSALGDRVARHRRPRRLRRPRHHGHLGPDLGEGPRPGRPHPPARHRRGQGGGAGGHRRPLDLAARAGDAQDPGPPRERRPARGEAAPRRADELARAPARGERGPPRQRRARAADARRRRAARLGRGVHADRAAPDRRRPRADRHASRRWRTRSPTTSPRRSSPPASRAGAGARRSARSRRRRRSAGTPERQAGREGSRRSSPFPPRRPPRPSRRPRKPALRQPRLASQQMLLLLGVAFVAGIVTAVSPCVLPVLPVVFAGGATRRAAPAVRDRRRAGHELHRLHARRRPRSCPRSGCPTTCSATSPSRSSRVVGLSLVWPRLGDLLGRPFYALARRSPSDIGGGFVLGLSLGLLFTPCAGPGDRGRRHRRCDAEPHARGVPDHAGLRLGAGLVLLGVAIAARRGMNLRAVRAHAPAVRRGARRRDPRRRRPHDPRRRQGPADARARVHARAPAARGERVGTRPSSTTSSGSEGIAEEEVLADYGPAPEFEGIEAWINSQPLTMASLRGKVVVLDFWTYSCINCLRTLPHIKAWYDAYREDGLVVVGVHTPEFAFEREPDNVERAVRDHGIDYPVALDPDFGTWQAWDNQYWPAKYFVDRQRAHPLRALRRGRLRGERGDHPRAPGGGRGRLPRVRRDRGRDADRAADAGELSRLRADRSLRRLADRPRPRGGVHDPEVRPASRRSPTAAAGRSRRSGSSPARTPACACASSAARSSSSSGPRATARPWRSTVDGARVGTAQVTAGRPLHAGPHSRERRASTRSTSVSRRGPRPTPSRSGRAARCSAARRRARGSAPRAP